MALPPGVEDLDSLALLVSVAELGSVAQAAERHGISQPSASTRLRRLERRLGLVLLDRATTGSVPTPAGQSVVEWTREVLAVAERMGRAVAALRGEDRTVTLAASTTVADHLLPGWLAAVHRRDPGVAFQVRIANSAAVVDQVRAGEATLGIVETTEPVGGLRTAVVARDRLLVVVEPSHPWARRRTPLTVELLARTPLVLREVGSGTRACLEAALATHGRSLAPPALELPSTAAVRNAAIAGVGPAVLSELALADDLDAGRLVAVPVPEVDLARPLRALWRNAAPPVLRWLTEAAGPHADEP